MDIVGLRPLRLCPCIRLRPSAVRPVGQGKNRTGDRTPGVKRQELPEEMNVHYGDPCHLLSVRYGTLCVRVLIEHWSSLGRVDVGIVVQVEPRARCRGCLRKWDVVARGGARMWWHSSRAWARERIKGQYRLSGCPLRWPCLQRPVVIIDLLPSGQHAQ